MDPENVIQQEAPASAPAPRKKMSRKEKLDNAQAEIAQKVKALNESVTDKDWKKVLDVMASLPTYSFKNQILIMTQQASKGLDTGSPVASYNKWKSLGINVIKGATAITILAPIVHKVPVLKETMKGISWDEAKKNYKKDDYIIQRFVKGFIPVNVFSSQQTDLKDKYVPAPYRAKDVDFDLDSELFNKLKTFAESQGFSVLMAENSNELGGAQGITDYKLKTVTIDGSLPAAQQTKTLAHECAHVLLHGTRESIDKPREIKEIEAESVAYTVMKAYGYDTSSYSIPYVASWLGKNEENIIEALGDVQKATKQILTYTLGAENLPGLVNEEYVIQARNEAAPLVNSQKETQVLLYMDSAYPSNLIREQLLYAGVDHEDLDADYHLEDEEAFQDRPVIKIVQDGKTIDSWDGINEEKLKNLINEKTTNPGHNQAPQIDLYLSNGDWGSAITLPAETTGELLATVERLAVKSMDEVIYANTIVGGGNKEINQKIQNMLDTVGQHREECLQLTNDIAKIVAASRPQDLENNLKVIQAQLVGKSRVDKRIKTVHRNQPGADLRYVPGEYTFKFANPEQAAELATIIPRRINDYDLEVTYRPGEEIGITNYVEQIGEYWADDGKYYPTTTNRKTAWRDNEGKVQEIDGRYKNIKEIMKKTGRKLKPGERERLNKIPNYTQPKLKLTYGIIG